MRKIFEILIEVDYANEVRGKRGSACMVGFHGSVESSCFTGKVLEGGVDTQMQISGGRRKLSARYLLEGKDGSGKPCRIFLENNGQENEEGVLERTKPVLLTDSEELAWLETAPLFGTISGRDGGLVIGIYSEEEKERENEEEIKKER